MVKLAINGLGRIGRAVFKIIAENHPDLELVAINDLTDIKTLAHLLKYDSVYGVYNKKVEALTDSDNFLVVDNKKIQVFSEPNPEKLPWKDLDIDVVLECTGYFSDTQGAGKHILAGAKKVIVSANSKSETMPHFVLGVNENKYDFEKHNIVAMCSCTTNCAAPIINILNQNLGISKLQMLTVHAITSTQKLVDSPHKDLRRARAGCYNIIPTTTGAAKAVIRVLPELKGKIAGSALRVPVISGSILEIVAQTEKPASVKQINDLFTEQAENKLKTILGVSDNHLVSSDIVGSSFSGIVDLPLTEVLQDNFIKVLAWYDNEWAYACRLADFAEYVAKKA